MKDDKTTPKSLLEIGDAYVQATWHHPEANTEIIAIYRDKGDGQWVMDQPLRGPWTVSKDGEVYNDYRIAQDAFKSVSVHAMALFARLQEDGVQGAKNAWSEEGGTVYDL
jgi:hypothetical protein